MTIALPDPIAAYYAAGPHKPSEVAACFARDAVIIDEKRTYSGRAEIEGWATEILGRYADLVVTPTAVVDRDGRTIVTAHVSGDFPGSPVDLDYAFELATNEITRLEITQ